MDKNFTEPASIAFARSKFPKMEVRTFTKLPASVEERSGGPDKNNVEGDSIVGYGAIFHQSIEIDLGIESYTESISPKAFNKTLADGRDFLVCFNHDFNLLLGSTKANAKMSVDDFGLRYETDPIDTSVYRDTAELIRTGVVDSASFMFYVIDQEWIAKEEGGYHRLIKEVALIEAGPVALPAYSEATAALRSLEKFKSEKVLDGVHPSRRRAY